MVNREMIEKRTLKDYYKFSLFSMDSDNENTFTNFIAALTRKYNINCTKKKKNNYCQDELLPTLFS